MKKLFGQINMTWIKVIVFAVLAGIYTAVMAILPITKDTSFRDISISFEVWVLFGILIIVNSKSPIDSALKCFVFFLISQPLVYLIQVPFNVYGWEIFKYYPTWFMWTLITIPMGFAGYFMKKDKWWGLLILTPMLVFVGYHYYGFLKETISFFPNHLLSAIFCIATIIIYPVFIFKDKIVRIVGACIGTVIIIVMTVLVIFSGTNTYSTSILVSESSGITFDDTYKFTFEDESFGELYPAYEEGLEDYVLNVDFRNTGETRIFMESPSGEKKVIEIKVGRDTYDILSIKDE